MKRIYPTLSMILLLGLQATPTFAQNDDFVKQFQQARQGMMDDYNKFRNTILTDYDKYMQGVWKEYKKFKGDIRSQVPKPKTPPTYTEPKQPEKPVTVKPKMPVSPIAPKVRPTIDPVNKPKLPEVKPDIPDIEYTGSGIDIPEGGLGEINKKPDLTKVPALPTDPLAKVPTSKKNPKAPTIRPGVDPVNKPKLPEVKPDIPDIEYTGSGIDIPEGGLGEINKKPDLTKVPALPTDPLAKVPTSKKNPKAPTIRPGVDPVNKPKLPEVKPDIPDIEYTGSGIELPLMPAVSAIPVMPALPNIGHVKVPVSKQTIDVDYYGENIQFQKAMLLAKKDIASTNDVVAYWKSLKKSDLKEVTQAFATESRKMGLSDWASAMLVEKYINAVMPNASQNEKIVAAQYVLVNCGYNIRLGMNDHQVAMLVPYAEHVFEKSYINIDGKKYYIYPNIDDSGAFRTCDLPKDAELGKDMELRFTGKTVIGSGTKPFSYEAAGITLKGEVPTGIMPMLDEYPVIDIPTVASSVVDKKFRNEVVEQIRTQVAGLDEQDAANRILRFIQKGFPYATDDEQFKREKYFYFEETLYYPLCDCEDRAIFYAYLVHEILGLDVHLIQFPGHECTAVAFNQPVANGTSYEYKGKTYYICDPTYIGARIGRCMPSYAKESPQIEVWY